MNLGQARHILASHGDTDRLVLCSTDDWNRLNAGRSDTGLGTPVRLRRRLGRWGIEVR